MALETTSVISKWTGPRTAAGKERSCLNALKHGLTSRRIVLPYENQAEYDALLKDLLDESQPVGTLEFELVNDIAAAIWRLRRVRHREGDLAEVALGLKTSKQAREEFALMLRYTGAIERELHRAIIRLNQVQELRHKRDERRRKDQECPMRRAPEVFAVAQAASPQPHTTESDFVSSSEFRPTTPPHPSAQLTTDNRQLTTSNELLHLNRTL
jgi:hypothetical protein